MKRAVVAAALCVVLAACGGEQAPGDSDKTPAPSASAPVEATTPSGVAMLLVPGGTFTMGSADGAADEAPAHEVTVTGFAMDKYEVTQDQYAALEIPDPSHFKDPRRPVEQVRWSDAALFCNERSRQDGLEPCYDDFSFACNFDATGYRLPTEAEWEYAARAGTATAYDFGGDAGQLGSRAWYAANASKKTGLVGKRKPNAREFCDLYGNVLEWCNDIYGAEYYASSPAADPRGPEEGEKRVLRGGAWDSSAEGCRAAVRYAEMPGITDACFARDTFGFRCVRRLTPEEAARVTPAE